MAVVLDRYGAGWLKWAIPFVSLPELSLNTFCAIDPPALPTFTAAESKALVSFILGPDFDSGLAKFGDLIQHLAWLELCHCTSGTPSAYPVAPAPPAGTPVLASPPLVTPAGCQFVPGWAGTLGSGNANNDAFFAAGLNPTSFQGTFIWSSAGAGPHPTQTYSVSFSGPGLPAGTGTRSQAATINVPLTMLVPVPAGATRIFLSVSCTPGGTDTTTTSNTLLYCDGAVPGVPATACCPPDPATELQLQAILRMVTLIQRQAVPFAYLTGTAHAGLTGSGNLEIAGLIGAKVTLTSVPGSLGLAGALPQEVFDAGFLTWGTDDGYPQSERIRHTPYLSMPSRCSAFTDLSYDLHPGVVATITELVREP